MRLPTGSLVSHGGLKGVIVSHNPDTRIANSEEKGEWYNVRIYADKNGKLWKVERKYLVVRRLGRNKS